MKPSVLCRTAALLAAGAAASSLAWAQQRQGGVSAAAAEQSYERLIAQCNSGTLPAPERAACVRAAGRTLDRTLGGPPVEAPRTTPDGRSTVVAPVDAARPADDSDTTTSRDGRATIVLPADRSTPR